ncbi:SDS3 deacetylase, partial [Oceanites oceanicus]|nr:SDS3 deacetylase [Oceanites oceanicus]
YEEEELESAEEEDGERSARARDSDEDTEDASETDLAKHEEEDFVEMKEQMYQDKLASLKRQLQQLQEGTLQEYQKRMKKLDQQYKERIRNAGKLNFFLRCWIQLKLMFLELVFTVRVPAWRLEAIAKESNFLYERGKIIFLVPSLQLHYSTDSMEVKPIMTRKLRRRPNDPVPIPDKRRKPAPDILSQSNWRAIIFEASMLPSDVPLCGGRMLVLNTVSFLFSASPSSPEHLPATPAESPAQRFEARIEDGKLYYDKRWYHKSQAIYLESKENTKISCVISSVGANEIWVRKTSDSTKMRIYLGQLQRGVFVIRRRSAA